MVAVGASLLVQPAGAGAFAELPAPMLPGQCDSCRLSGVTQICSEAGQRWEESLVEARIGKWCACGLLL